MRKKETSMKVFLDGKKFLCKATSTSPCKCLVRGLLTRPRARCIFPNFPSEAAALASPQLALPSKRVEGMSNFLNWQMNAEYEDSQGTGSMASVFLENDRLFVSSPWNLRRMSWILCLYQVPGWPCPETLTPGGKERSFLPMAGSLPPPSLFQGWCSKATSF